MKNPAQVRAGHALAIAKDVKAKDDEGEAISGFPGLILRSGLLPALAFSMEKNEQGQRKRDAYARIANALADHLAKFHTGENLLDPQAATGDGLLKKLTESDSLHLRRCTTEAMEYLGYLKRFAS